MLSNRADLVSAGDALVAISYDKAVNPGDIRVKLGATDITSAFAVRENGRFEGLVRGLAVGKDNLQALLPSGQGAALTITNHPNGGPVFSTDQGKTVPFIIRTETGYQARDQYKITVLYDPAKPWSPWAPQPGVLEITAQQVVRRKLPARWTKRRGSCTAAGCPWFG